MVSDAFALDPAKTLASYQRQSWQSESGLPQNTVHDILQTQDGYLWLATEGGVVRFDGLQFTTFDTQNTHWLQSNSIHTLFESPMHSLLIGTADGLAVYWRVGGQSSTNRQSLLANGVLQIFEDSQHRLWFATADGLVLNQDGAGPQRFNVSASAIAEDSAGTLWIGARDGLRRFSNGAFQVVESGLEGISALAADESGRLWIGTSHGLLVREGETVREVSQTPPGIHGLLKDRAGALWIGTESGLGRLIDGHVDFLPTGGPVLSLLEDHEGNLWFGSEANGLSVLRDPKFVVYGAKEGLADDVARCVYQDRSGAVWIGTNTGLTKFANGTFTSLTTKDGLSSNLIFALGENADGDLLAGTPDGLNVIRDGRISVVTSANGLADDFVRSIYVDRDRSVWIGTRSGLSHWTGAGFKTYRRADGLGSDFVGALTRDNAGRLWIGTLEGLSVYEGGRFRTYTTKDGLTNNVVTAICEGSGGTLWIGTKGGGLNRFSNGSFHREGQAVGVPTSIYGLVSDGSDAVWISSGVGIFKLREKTGTVTRYGTSDGLRVSEGSEGGHPSVWRDNHGALWFATRSGVAVISREMARGNPALPTVVIEKLVVDGKTRETDAAQTIAPGPGRISIVYTGLSFISPQYVHFRYRLEGFGSDWVDTGTQREVSFTNLSPGSYRFAVEARTNDRDWEGDPAFLSFRIQPHFYETYWFYAGVLGLMALGIYGIYRWRVREVEAQFNAVLAERNRIAREIHDTLAQGFVAVSVQLELIARQLDHATPAVTNLLRQTRELVQSSLGEARRSIWQLRSQASEARDFATRVSQMAESMAGRAGIKLEFRVSGVYRPMPAEIEDELLKIGQEAVTNSVRHGHPKLLRIDLVYEPKKVRMTIADDGLGFTGAEKLEGPEGHFGLRGMRERAEQIDAEIHIRSTPGEGTQVEVEKAIS